MTQLERPLEVVEQELAAPIAMRSGEPELPAR